jgi:hypothetical protein
MKNKVSRENTVLLRKKLTEEKVGGVTPFFTSQLKTWNSLIARKKKNKQRGMESIDEDAVLITNPRARTHRLQVCLFVCVCFTHKI